MTTIPSQFEELKLAQEDLEAASTILTNQQRKNSPSVSPIAITSSVPLVARTSAKYRNNKARDYYLASPFPKSVALYSFGQPDQLNPIKEQAKDSQDDIAVHTLVHPVARKIHSLAEASQRRRTGKLSAPLISRLPTDLSNLPFNILKNKNAALEAQRHQKLQTYLDSLRDEARATRESEFSERVLDIAWLVWTRLRKHFMKGELCLEVPDACPGQKDNFMYTWSQEEHYLECEIFGSGEIEFFYRNRETGKNWGEDTTIGQAFSPVILEKVELFTQ
jgi:hypothetical protein